jgi:hypothetical protein
LNLRDNAVLLGLANHNLIAGANSVKNCFALFVPAITAALIVLVVGVACQQKTPVPTPTPTPSMHSSRLIAERFLQKTPTFVFDGLPASLTLKNVERCEPMETCFTFVFNFKSTHPGYGDRGGQVLAQVLTEHEARVTTEQERITRVILDSKWDEQAQRYLPGMGP